ncbi:MAG: undecaprenyldiphospho-muramoylpentapeptide beta-N-acetylglucosaminyltransferase [Calditrichaeota bacterium]|nr:MAG: undecaprenyldiphospho-muramoylpentapeptide beta-N-acetylglucosaminyltransferase [Calditrichota bacterium]
MEGRILIAGGGTGGHIYPAIATIEALRELGDFQFLYVGARGGLETRLIPPLGIPLRRLWISGFQRYWTWRNLLFPLKVLVSLVLSWFILRQFRPDVAVGTGGYVTGPILFLAARQGIPVLIQEQDVHPGVTTRLLARYASRICLAYEAARTHFAEWSEKVAITGNPVRQELLALDREAARAHWGIAPERTVLLVFGGSQGAQAINRALEQVAPRLLESYDLEILWQTGRVDWERVQGGNLAGHPRVHPVPYIEEMALAYGAADLIVSRAGALTLAELAVVGRPAILVPYPHAAGDHQRKNALAMQQAGAALVVEEAPGWEARLLEALKAVLDDPDKSRKMAQAWKPLARPHAARAIAKEVVQLLREHRPQETAVQITAR